MINEMRLILRSLLQSPLFTVTAVASLALGIGANTAIFSMMDRVLFRTLPVDNPHELVFLYHPGPLQGSSSSDEPGGAPFSYPMFRGLQTTQTPFVGIAGSRSFPASLAYRNQAALGTVMLVSGNYLSLLGVDSALGRIFTQDDDGVPGGHPLVILSHGYWSTRFGRDPGVLNSTMVVNGHPMTIVGVTQKGFVSDSLGNKPDAFVPITMKREITPGWDGMNDRQWYWVTLAARLKPGISRERATAEINAAYRAELEHDIPLATNPDPDFQKRFRAKTIVLRDGRYGRGTVREEGRRPLLLLVGMTLLVLLIAIANVANLQLTRAATRAREFAVRLAIGASRSRLVQQHLMESCLIAIVGGVLGLAVAQATVRGILQVLPAQAGAGNVITTELDVRILAFALGLSVLAGILFGLYPALQASRHALVGTLKDQSGQSTATPASGRFRKILVIMQTAMSLLLLICAGLFGKTLLNLTRLDVGFNVDHLLTFSVLPKLNGYTDERALAFYLQLTERLQRLPGVTLVSAARVAAIAGSANSANVTVEGFKGKSADEEQTYLNQVGPAYFKTLGIPLLAGREFTISDTRTAPGVAIVNEAFARHFLPNQNPIGRRLARGSGDNIELNLTIVGVVKDARYSDLRDPPPRVLYTPYIQLVQQSTLHYYIRTAMDPEHLAETIRAQVAALDPYLPIRDLRTMEAQVGTHLSRERLLSSLTGVFAGLATLLAAIGLYGVLAYNVARRTREIGIRMALGAGRQQVRRLVIRDVALVIGMGVAVGLASAALVARLLESVLFGMARWDPAVFVAAPAVMAGIAMLAAYVPARRATRVDPMIALRYE